MSEETQEASPASTDEPTPDVDQGVSSSANGVSDSEGMLAAAMEVAPPDPSVDSLDTPDEGTPTSEPEQEVSTEAAEVPQTEQPLPDAQAAQAEAQAEKTVTEELDSLTEAEIQGYNPKTQKRIQQFLEERSQLREETKTLQASLDEAQKVAQPVSELREFLTNNHITPDAFSGTMEALAALRQGNYQKFLEQVTPAYQQALEATGQALPQDLYGQVQEGALTEQAAVEMSKQRYQLQMAQEEAQRAEQQTANLHQQQSMQDMQTTLNAWETKKRSEDTEYSVKQDLVQTHVRSLIQQLGPPPTAIDAIEYADEAYRRANELLQGMQPRPQATHRVPDGTGGATPVGVGAEPQNMMDAAMQGLQNARQR